jgi:anti-anti-sigma factor
MAATDGFRVRVRLRRGRTKVTFLDSTGIGVLVGQRSRLIKGDGDLVLRGPENIVRRTLEVVGLAAWIED